MMKKKLSIKKSKGFSFVELMVVIAIVALVSVTVTAMIVSGAKQYRKAQEIIDMQENASKAMRDFEKISRGATEVLTSDADEFEFYSYLAGDDHPAPSKIKYYCVGTDLKKSLISPEGEGPVFSYPAENETVFQISEYVRNCDNLFTYFNDSSQEITFPVMTDAVKMVKISVTVDKMLNEIPEAITESTSVSLRNVKTNL